jgi:hypothetical protein
VETRALQKILASVRPGLAKKDIVEQTTHFIFTGDEVITYNDQICILHPLKTAFTGSVKADDLYRIISSIPDKECELVQEKTQLRVLSKSTKAGFALLGEKDIHTRIRNLGLIEEKQWSPLPEDFIAGVFLCMFSASKDETSAPNNCIFVNGKDMWAGEEVRISHYMLKESMPTFLLKASAAVELVKFPVKEYCIGDSWLHFKTEDGVVFNAIRMIGEDKYPDLAEYFEVEGSTIQLPQELKSVVESIAAMTEAEIELEKTIEIEIRDKKLRCEAKKEKAWAEKFVDIETDEHALFHINPVFLAQVLDKSTSATIGEYVVRFEAGSFKHVIALRPPKD